jgi:hypothetical protein
MSDVVFARAREPDNLVRFGIFKEVYPVVSLNAGI